MKNIKQTYSILHFQSSIGTYTFKFKKKNTLIELINRVFYIVQRIQGGY